ncbi:MAG: glycosyltransferase family 2 protein [Fimbriimonadales bacterium]
MLHCPKVSVITPAYNAAPYIGQAIESVQAQTLADWEMIIVDDASTDGTAQAVQPYLSDPRIRFLQNERNMGVSYTRNRALDVAQGEWIAVLDADDWYAPERLEALIGCAAQMAVDVVADLMVYYTSWGSIYTISWALRAKPPKVPRRYSVEAVIRADISVQPVIRRAFLEQHQIRYHEPLRRTEDYAFLIATLLYGAQFALLPKPLYYYRIQPGTSVTRYDALTEGRKAMDYLQSLPVTTPRVRRLLDQAYRRRITRETYPQFARAVKQRQWRKAYQLLRNAPAVLGWLITSLPAAVYRRLFDREKLLDPWRERAPR